jgi:large repetitive protein
MKANVAFLVLVIAGQLPQATAQSPGTFTATGSMISPRAGHTATLLSDGSVLIAGGNSFDSFGYKILSSVELYDPRTGRFTATSNMLTRRSWHTATLLPDGRVLIAGGSSGADAATGAATALSSAEIYDPRTRTFTAAGEMSARYSATATLLNSGKVLIAGGVNPGQGYCCFPVGAELYDPHTGTFTATGDMTEGWADTATLLANSKVLITRGHPVTGPDVSSAELYDPTSGTFTVAGYTTTNHTGATATLMTNGRVLMAGGDIGDGDGGSAVAELYDSATGAFSRTGNMTVGREQHTETLLPDGSVLFAGGHLTIDLAATAEIYDPIGGAFTRTANMPTAHELHTATLLADGTILLAGGYMPWPALTSNVEIYHPAVLVPSPQLFSVSGDGRGQGAILHANTAQLASPENPAAVGDALEI